MPSSFSRRHCDVSCIMQNKKRYTLAYTVYTILVRQTPIIGPLREHPGHLSKVTHEIHFQGRDARQNGSSRILYPYVLACISVCVDAYSKVRHKAVEWKRIWSRDSVQSMKSGCRMTQRRRMARPDLGYALPRSEAPSGMSSTVETPKSYAGAGSRLEIFFCTCTGAGPSNPLARAC